MKSNKGFTLIELLAVIVILAIIALIATPMILGVVETARKGAAESSILGYIDAVEKQAKINEMDTNDANNIADGTYNVTATGIQSTEAGSENITIDVKGQRPETTTAAFGIDDGQVQTSVFRLGKYYVSYNQSTGQATASTTAPAAETTTEP